MDDQYRYVSQIEQIESILQVSELIKINTTSNSVEGYVHYNDTNLLVFNYSHLKHGGKQSSLESCIAIVDVAYLSMKIQIGLLMDHLPAYLSLRHQVVFLPSNINQLINDIKNKGKVKEQLEFNPFCFG